MDLCYSQKFSPINIGKKLLVTAAEIGLDAAETASKKGCP